MKQYFLFYFFICNCGIFASVKYTYAPFHNVSNANNLLKKTDFDAHLKLLKRNFDHVKRVKDNYFPEANKVKDLTPNLITPALPNHVEDRGEIIYIRQADLLSHKPENVKSHVKILANTPELEDIIKQSEKDNKIVVIKFDTVSLLNEKKDLHLIFEDFSKSESEMIFVAVDAPRFLEVVENYKILESPAVIAILKGQVIAHEENIDVYRLNSFMRNLIFKKLDFKN